MWIHEVKIPISSLVLMSHNHKELNNTYINEVKKLNDYVDQVLYYVRSNYAENDYIIKENNLDKIIKDFYRFCLWHFLVLVFMLQLRLEVQICLKL